MSAMPWAQLLAAAARMGVTPEAFWRLSLKEWRLLTAGAGEAGLTQAEFAALAADYPDKGDGDE